MRRFRVGSLEVDETGLVRAEAGVHRHLRVLRSTRGDVVRLFDGGGREVEAEIVTIDDANTVLRILRPVERLVESPLDSCLVQAVPARSSRMETIVRQVTELGVQRIVPVVAARSQWAGGTASLERRAQRWRRVADAAAEQSRRTLVPTIDSPVRFRELRWEEIPRPAFIADAGGTPNAELPVRADAVSVAIGPEGGWDPDEIEQATAEGAATLYLGPRVLRADTAGAVALALFQQLWGDLR